MNTKFLRDILQTSFINSNPYAAAQDIINKLLNRYKVKYCTIFGWNEEDKNYYCLGSNVQEQYTDKLTRYIESLENQKGNSENGIIVCSQEGLEYLSAAQRSVKYSFYIPLDLGGKKVGALLMEHDEVLKNDAFILDFFRLVVENIAISIQHLMFLEKIVESAQKDYLTKLYNRNYFYQFMDEAIKYKAPDKFCIAMMDIDYFKKVNDTYGHQVGDDVLKSVAQALSKNFNSKNSCVARFGGEEFIIYEQYIDTTDFFNRVDQLRADIGNIVIKPNNTDPFNVTCSFGISCYPDNTKDYDNINILIKLADEALYKSKSSGRNKVTLSLKNNESDMK